MDYNLIIPVRTSVIKERVLLVSLTSLFILILLYYQIESNLAENPVEERFNNFYTVSDLNCSVPMLVIVLQNISRYYLNPS